MFVDSLIEYILGFLIMLHKIIQLSDRVGWGHEYVM